ncbi:chitin deacetylase CDA4 [Aspergillus ibericus CBS 121593]|uniref:chitin deacetylase n=1 Tax=Aspergillus ibericus CBS 121593 TaxID=1448316 RepID=A0A395GVJ7_9EURO|nr:glycoside hydrolase/deacetylase [Aspergillus ibericus CBS 121593]RAK99028.1 glycoside hydrolase/deacetylase [Aspergillus ibericus CBS 121593]
MPRLHPTTLLLLPLRLLATPITLLTTLLRSHTNTNTNNPRSHHLRRRRRLTMLLLTLLLLLLLILTPCYLIYRPPISLINYLATRYPDTLWTLPFPPNPSPHNPKLIALTLDDAPSPYTPLLLQTLLTHTSTATFFLIGNQITPQTTPLLTTLVQNGMELGNHAMHDEPSFKLSPTTLRTEITAIDNTIKEIYKSANVERKGKWFRPGSGVFTGWMREMVQELGYRIVLGSVYPHDAQIGWVGLNVWHVGGLSREGSIVVLHDRRGWTVEVLDRVLRVLRGRGYRVVSVGEAMEAAKAAAAAAAAAGGEGGRIGEVVG